MNKIFQKFAVIPHVFISFGFAIKSLYFMSNHFLGKHKSPEQSKTSDNQMRKTKKK